MHEGRWVRIAITAVGPPDERDPALGFDLTDEVARDLLPGHGGTVVLPRSGAVVSYVSGRAVVDRRLDSVSLAAEGGRVDLALELGDVTGTEGELDAPLEPTAEGRLFGQITLHCAPLGPDGGSIEDASWSSPFCARARRDFQLDALLESR